MNNQPYRLVFSVSLVANALLIGALAYAWAGHTQREAGARRAVSQSQGAGKAREPDTPAQDRVSGHVSPETPGAQRTSLEILTYLKQCGLSNDLLVVFASLLSREREQLDARFLNLPGNPIWRTRSARLTSEQRQAHRQAQEKSAELSRQMLAELGIDPRYRNPYERVRYAAFDEEKAAGLQKILDDYSTIRRENRITSLGGRSPAFQTLQSEMQRDIQALLSPEEYQHYALYLSDAASELQGRIGDAAVDDDQYVRLFQAEADYGKRFREGKNAGSVREQNFDYRAGRFEIVRSIVGDENAMIMEVRHDSTFNEITPLLRAGGATTSQLLDKYQAYLNLHAAMWTNSDTRPLKAKIAYDTFIADLTPEAQTQFNATKLARLLRSMQESSPTPPR